LDAELR
jgi:hypothetical protein